MNEVDAILAGHSVAVTESGPEIDVPVERYARAPHAAVVRELTSINGWHSTLAIAIQWAAIIGSLVAGVYIPVWWVWLLGGIVIGTRLQAMGVLLHDAAHYSLYKNRVVNDVVSDMTLAFPIGMSTTLYRKTHFRHHRFVNTSQDQDLAAQREEQEWYAWPKTRVGLVRSLVRAILGGNTHRAWILYKHWAPWKNLFTPVDADFPMRARVLYVFSVAVIYGLVGWGIAYYPRSTLTVSLMYVIPTITLLNLINRIRATAEHIGTQNTHELNSTRTVLPAFWERLTIAPYNVSYHLEHHLFPSVPARNLIRLHHHLMEDPEYRAQAHITRGYRGFFQEVMALPEDGTENSPASS